MSLTDTRDQEYTQRLVTLENVWWKKLILGEEGSLI